jgi:hypothetical protein
MRNHLRKTNSKGATIRTIGILGYADVQALDLIGPSHAFAIADEHLRARGSTAGYKVVVLGLSLRTFAAESGVLFKPHTTYLAWRNADLDPRVRTTATAGSQAREHQRGRFRAEQAEISRSRRSILVAVGTTIADRPPAG